jgi:hypothetical protein
LRTDTDLFQVANRGIGLVTGITKYLSTLPHPIEIVEELVAVCAVISTLLTSLHATLQRFPHLRLSRTHSFITLLSHDVLFAFKLLGSGVEEARRMRVFEPNDVGLVRLPRAAWVLVMGTEAKMAALRSRLYVEKYRVRVLIEAVSWAGLESLESRTEKQEEELRSLQKMLPLIAERLIGVQKDYVPRLTPLLAHAPIPTLPPTTKDDVVEKEVKQEQVKPVVERVDRNEYARQEINGEKAPFKVASSKLSLYSASTVSLVSTSSSSSSCTAFFEDSIFETWLLRHNPERKSAKDSISVFGIPVRSTYTITAASYYVKPVSCCLSEIKDLRKTCQAGLSEEAHTAKFRKTILGMDDDAQWEVQRLIEAREKASSSESVKRVWSIVAFMERPRRNISASPSSGKRGRWFRRNKEAVEWVLVLKGETVDERSRTLPGKHDDPWARPTVPTQGNPVQSQAQIQGQQLLRLQQQQQQRQQQQRQQQHAGSILRHVEDRRSMSAAEARRKMDEIIDQLFVVQKDPCSL